MSVICIFNQNLPSIFVKKILQFINFHLRLNNLCFRYFFNHLPNLSTLSAYLYKKCTAEKGCVLGCKP